MRRDDHTTSPRWPFWLLIAAWVCANSPQAATYAVLAWLADARHFSHQQQLTRDVAHLLAGEKAPPRAAPVVAVNNEREPTTPFSTVPAAAVLKKIDLSSEKGSGLVRPASIAVRHFPPADRCGATLRAPPPHGPPRAERSA